MNVILLEKIANLGKLGDKVSVKAGYARNFLLPKSKAVVANDANEKFFQERRAELEAKEASELAAAQTRADNLAALASVVIASKAGDEGKLFGSVGTRDIADAVTAAGVKITKAEVRLPLGALRTTGDFEVEVQLHTEVKGSVKISVVAED